MNEKKYLVIDTPDEYIIVFDSAEEATAEAERIADLLKGAIDDDGNIDWGFNSGGHDYDGCFDSERF